MTKLRGARLATVIATAFVLFPETARSQGPETALRTVVGKQMILVGRGNEASIRLNPTKLAHISGSCDLAVDVATGDWRDGDLSLLLKTIGYPRMDGVNEECRFVRETIPVVINGIDAGTSANAVSALLRNLLQTPEEFLARHGVSFDLPPGRDDEELPKNPAAVEHPKLLLKVEGMYTEPARKQRISGAVTLRFAVGTDGRVHQAYVMRPLGSGLDESALGVLPMWRFEPARLDGQPVAAHATVLMDFRMY